jgi:hypothetical protein
VLCWLALLLIRVAETTTGQTWASMRRELHRLHAVDPNAIALEASWWVVDPTGRIADYADPELFSDPNPVPAVRELQHDGRLARIPHTTLSSDEVMDPA